MSDLIKLGWNEFFESQLTDEERQHAVVARIVEPSRGLSRAVCRFGEVWAESKDKANVAGPSVGDWVVGAVRDFSAGEKRLSIDRLLQRQNKLSRTAPGGQGYEQILCANVDTAFIVIALNQNLNLRAVERYLEIVKDNAIQAVLVVTKVDEGTDPGPIISELERVAPKITVHPISVKQKRGLDPIHDYFLKSKTVVLLGASGAGKSTLVNYLIQTNLQRVEEVRGDDQKGRHTTTGRRLHSLPTGGMVIDSPGIREIQKWEAPPPKITPGKAKEKTRPQVFRSSRISHYTDDDE